MGRRQRQLRGRKKFPANQKCPCKSGLKYKFCHGCNAHTQLCKVEVARKLLYLIGVEKLTHYFKVWRLLWFLLRPFGVRRPKCPCGSGLRHRYCHGSQKKANACREVYTSRMKVCIEEAKARRAAAMFDKINKGHEYVESKDCKFESGGKNPPRKIGEPGGDPNASRTVNENSKKGQ